jgi:hypothetical protein
MNHPGLSPSSDIARQRPCNSRWPGQIRLAGGLDPFVGTWSWAGHFTANDRPISAHFPLIRDEATGALIVRHDDDPPAGYHALEV